MKPKLWSLVACGLIFLAGCTAPARETTQPPPAPAVPAATQPKEPDIAAKLKKKIDKLIHQLAAEDFTTREAAETELRNLLLKYSKNFDFVLAHTKHHLDIAKDPEVKTRLERMKIEQYLEWGITGPLLKQFPDILAQLTSPDGFDRYNIVERLGNSKHPDATNTLLKALCDKDEDVREVAARGLGQIGDPRAIESLVWALTYTEHSARSTVEAALCEFGEQAAKSLVKALSDKYPKMRAAAAWALCGFEDCEVTDAVDTLINALSDSEWDVRRGAAAALGKFGGAKAVEPLIKLLGDPDHNVRARAAWSLAEIKDMGAVEPLIKTLSDPVAWVRKAAMEALIEIGEPAVESLARALTHENAEMREEAADALGNFGDSAVQSLAKVLGGSDVKMRRLAAWTLHNIGSIRAAQALLKSLGDKDEEVRGNAVAALGEIKAPKTVEPLIEALGDANRDIRESAANALGEIGDLRAVEPLIEVLADKDDGIRFHATYALGQLAHPKAGEALIKALADQDVEVRERAAWALAEIGKPALGKLREALGEEKDEKKKAKLKEIIEKIEKK